MKYLFNDGWRFLRTDLGVEPETALERKEAFTPVQLPHDWLIADSRKLYEDGIGWYWKEFSWEEENRRAFLSFEGVYMDSTVFVNGRKAGEWKYGYSSFTLEITDFLRNGENRILVRVRYQSPNSRWYSGAGIYRNVWLEVTEETYLVQNGIYVSTRRQDGDFVLRVETQIGGEDAGYRVCHSLLDPDGKEVGLTPLYSRGTVQEYLVKSPVCWDVQNPALYVLRTGLWKEDRLCQQEETRIGFRTVSFSPREGFFLNGRHLKLNGVCEHHDLGALGAAFSSCAMARKLRILKEMGVNAVRGSHNMMAPGLLDLADEMGILLISEAFDMWERPKTEWDYARFFPEWHERDVESWIRRDRNHPSVILWSIGNEIYDTHADGRGQEITRRLKELVERHDPYRNASVTIASNYMPWENAQKCADILKIAGYNYAEKFYEAHHKAHPDWVIYGSETSSIVQSRGVYHFPLRAAILAEDDRQCSALGNSATSWSAKSMEDCIAVDRDTPFSLGQFLWSGFDYIGEPTPYHTKNSYFGQVDTAGFPKDSYYVWQSAWTDPAVAPMIHIFPYWDFNPGQMIDVRVCTNADSAELFLNGKSLGRQELTHAPGSGKKLIADYRVPYEEGELTAVAYDKEGRSIATARRRSFGNSKRLVIKPEKETLIADGKDLLFLEIGAQDEQGRPVENACDRVQVRVTGGARLVGLDNGDSTDEDSYKGVSKRMFNGKLLAILQSNPVQEGREPEPVIVEVSAMGLTGARLVCPCLACVDRGPVRWKSDTGAAFVGEENRERPLYTGQKEEIPVRRVTLSAPEGQHFSPEKRTLRVQARIEPKEAQDRELTFVAASANGAPSNLVQLEQQGDSVLLTALGDGDFYLRCLSKSGTDQVRVISLLEFSVQGLGPAYLDPYTFVAGSLYTRVRGEATSGNERGVATARDEETVVTFDQLDFGSTGSARITVPIFDLSGEPFPIRIWEGVPGEGGELLADVIYDKPSIWNVYQPESWTLSRPLKGITSLSFQVYQKVHIKGFSFERVQKAWTALSAREADRVYGDSYRITPEGVEEIGNNVSLVFSEMDFGQEAPGQLVIEGRAEKTANTIHLLFSDGQKEIRQILEFPAGSAYERRCFDLEPFTGRGTVTFVFLPGSCFDFHWFRFEKGRASQNTGRGPADIPG